MNTPTTGEIRPDSDPFSAAFRRLAHSAQAAHCLLTLAADFPHLPGARDLIRLRATSAVLTSLALELDELLERVQDAQRSQTTEGGAA